MGKACSAALRSVSAHTALIPVILRRPRLRGPRRIDGPRHCRLFPRAATPGPSPFEARARALAPQGDGTECECASMSLADRSSVARYYGGTKPTRFSPDKTMTRRGTTPDQACAAAEERALATRPRAPAAPCAGSPAPNPIPASQSPASPGRRRRRRTARRTAAWRRCRCKKRCAWCGPC
jgi:hypothetical protein